MNEKKWCRKAIHERVGESVATTQQVVAESIISSSFKKICVSGSLKEALRAEVLFRAHKRIILSQMSIDAALPKQFIQADLRAANNARLTTVVADMCHAENLQDCLVDKVKLKIWAFLKFGLFLKTWAGFLKIRAT